MEKGLEEIGEKIGEEIHESKRKHTGGYKTR
jgi:hypothetical protein